MTLLDANYILRYLMRDNEEMFLEASQFIEGEECRILGEVLAEVIYVLEGYYEVPRLEIARTLTILLNQPNLHAGEAHGHYMEALSIFEKNSLDYVDCLLCAFGQRISVATFDKKLTKCLDNRSGISREIGVK